ncbi:histone-like transcription factor and archaeal histone protein [Rutstroemia sp. NJR-2017a WRK4]|nr:histone-like transcription factor and archaeal histone protein [Rutstroemia sp. NJR-2017a WRK4]
MSNSPPKETEVEQGVSPDDPDAQMNEHTDPHASGAYEFEVKEQDRWLPIANGFDVTGIASSITSFYLYAHVFASGPVKSSGTQTNPSSGVTAVIYPIMSYASSSGSPEMTGASRDEKYDSGHSEANIRNFAPVARIMKTALPDNAKIAKEAKECMQECVSEFISFITSEASEKCHQEKRKTVNGEDILFAMTSLGFENYAEALKIYLSKYREQQSTRGENQNRPSSSGFGPAAGSSSTNATSTNFAGGSEGSNNVLAGQQVEGEHDSGAYVYGTGHNGATSGEGY